MKPLTTILTAILITLLSACSGPIKAARGTLHLTTEAVVLADDTASIWYIETARRALDASVTRAEYDAAMGGANDVETALTIARSTLLSLQSAIDVWESGGESDFMGMIPCMVIALRAIVETFSLAGIPIPSEVLGALTMAKDLIGGEARCF